MKFVLKIAKTAIVNITGQRKELSPFQNLSIIDRHVNRLSFHR